MCSFLVLLDPGSLAIERGSRKLPYSYESFVSRHSIWTNPDVFAKQSLDHSFAIIFRGIWFASYECSLLRILWYR